MAKFKKLCGVLAAAMCLCTVAAVGYNASGADSINAAATEPNVALSYILSQGNTGAVAAQTISAHNVEKTNALGQTLKGVELRSTQEYSVGNNNYKVNGYSMGYGQYLTLKIDDTIDRSQPVEFLFAPYVRGGTGGQANHRFVMALSDKDGEVMPLTTSGSVNGFNAVSDEANYIYWEFAKHQPWANAAAPETQGNGPNWYVVSSGDVGRNESVDTWSSSKESDIYNSRMGGGVLGRAFYGAEYTWGDSYTGVGENAQAFVKAKIEFTDTQLILYFDHVSEDDITSKGATSICSATHDFSADSAANCTTCYFKQTYNLSDIGFTDESEIKLYFGYYNVHARYSNQSYGDLPMSLKLYNYKNGEIKDFGVKEGKESTTISGSETLDVADVMDIVYYDGVATPTTTVSYVSSDETIAKIEDGKVVPVSGTNGGEVTITATASSGETATFKVVVDVNTVSYNGSVIASGDSYVIADDLYTGDEVLLGYSVNGAGLYAVGDTVTLTGDVTLTAVTVDFAMLYGGSIRLDATASLRFTAIINSADLAAVETLLGTENVNYGMTLTAAGKTWDLNSTGATFDTAVYENDYTLYSAVMTGIPESDYTTEFTAIGYISVKYTDGDTVKVSCALADAKDGDTKATNVRSLADVAKSAYEDRNATQTADKYKYVTTDGDYSAYTQTQLETIAKYFSVNE